MNVAKITKYLETGAILENRELLQFSEQLNTKYSSFCGKCFGYTMTSYDSSK